MPVILRTMINTSLGKDSRQTASSENATMDFVKQELKKRKFTTIGNKVMMFLVILVTFCSFIKVFVIRFRQTRRGEDLKAQTRLH